MHPKDCHPLGMSFFCSTFHPKRHFYLIICSHLNSQVQLNFLMACMRSQRLAHIPGASISIITTHVLVITSRVSFLQAHGLYSQLLTSKYGVSLFGVHLELVVSTLLFFPQQTKSTLVFAKNLYSTWKCSPKKCYNILAKDCQCRQNLLCFFKTSSTSRLKVLKWINNSIKESILNCHMTFLVCKLEGSFVGEFQIFM